MNNMTLLRDQRRIGWAIGLAGSIALLGGLGYQRLPKQTTVTPTAQAFATADRVSALGRLEPQGETIQVFAPLSVDGARVMRLAVQHGQQVRQGDVIAVLDVYDRREAALQEAQQQVEVARSQLAQVEVGAKQGDIQAQQERVNQLQAELATEQAAQQAVISRIRAERNTEITAQQATITRLTATVKNAALEDRRYQALFLEGAVAESLRDRNRLTLETAQAELAEAKANLDRITQSRQQQIQEAEMNLERIITSRQTQLAGANAMLDAVAEVRPVDVTVARSQLAKAEAGVKRAEADLALATVRSPQAGRVLKIHTRPGEIVGSQGIISLGQTQRMVAVAEVYETDLYRIKQGQSATVVSKNNAFTDQLTGTVSEVGLEINKQDVLNTDPAAQFDARVVEVKVLLDAASSQKVAGLTNLTVQVDIEVEG